MRKHTLFIAGLLLLMGAVCLSYAGDTGEPATGESGACAMKGAGKKAAWKKGQFVPPELREELNLSADQKTKIKAILKDRREQMKTVRQDSTLSKADTRKKINDIFVATQGKIDEILTPEQKRKADELCKQAREKMRERRKGVSSDARSAE